MTNTDAKVSLENRLDNFYRTLGDHGQFSPKRKDWEVFIEQLLAEQRGEMEEELEGFEFLQREAATVYDHIAGLSKLNYPASVIIAEFEDRNYDKECTQDDVREMIKSAEDKDDLIHQLTDYFNLTTEESK